jgi:hypothetical protein
MTTDQTTDNTAQIFELFEQLKEATATAPADRLALAFRYLAQQLIIDRREDLVANAMQWLS